MIVANTTVAHSRNHRVQERKTIFSHLIVFYLLFFTSSLSFCIPLYGKTPAFSPGFFHSYGFGGKAVRKQGHGHGAQEREQVALQLGRSAPVPVVIHHVGQPEQAGRKLNRKLG